MGWLGEARGGVSSIIPRFLGGANALVLAVFFPLYVGGYAEELVRKPANEARKSVNPIQGFIVVDGEVKCITMHGLVSCEPAQAAELLQAGV